MELLTPGLGLLFWQAAIFLIVVFVLGKFAWKPVLTTIKEREKSIEDALSSAEKVRQEMVKLTAENEKLYQEACIERDAMLAEAKRVKDGIIGEAKSIADVEARKIIDQARLEIENQKNAALTEVKNLVANLSIDIAEKILTKKFENEADQKALVNDLIKDINLN